jgi:hypothetical protein
VRKNPLGAFFTAVDGKGDALIEKRLVGLVFAASQLVRPEVQKLGIKLTILFAGMIDGAKHLVVSAIQLVPAKGFPGTVIGRIRLCNHGLPLRFDPRQNSASNGD